MRAFHGSYYRDYVRRIQQIDEAWMEQMVVKGEEAGEEGFEIHTHITR